VVLGNHAEEGFLVDLVVDHLRSTGGVDVHHSAEEHHFSVDTAAVGEIVQHEPRVVHDGRYLNDAFHDDVHLSALSARFEDALALLARVLPELIGQFDEHLEFSWDFLDVRSAFFIVVLFKYLKSTECTKKEESLVILVVLHDVLFHLSFILRMVHEQFFYLLVLQVAQRCVVRGAYICTGDGFV